MKTREILAKIIRILLEADSDKMTHEEATALLKDLLVEALRPE